MALKGINTEGVEYELSPEEEAAILAEWAQQAAKEKSVEYKDERKKEYDKQLGSAEEQLSTIYEYFSANLDTLEDSDFKDTIEKWVKIREDIPKPSKEDK